MALTSKLAQRNPAAATLEDAYTVPASTKFEGRVLVANRSASATAFRISLALAGAADDPMQYIAYDVAITGNDTAWTERFAIPAACVVRVYATLATLSFAITGLESPA